MGRNAFYMTVAAVTTVSTVLSTHVSADHCGWYGRGEALFLRRDNPEQLDIIQDGALAGDPTVLTTRSGDFNFEPGFRATLGRGLGCGRSVEATYFGLYNWNASNGVTSAAGGLDSLMTADSFFPDTSPFSVLFTDFDTAAMRAETEVHSFELNLRRHFTPIFTMIAGVRYIRVDDEFDIVTSEVDGPPFIGVRSYDTRATSDLFGAHLGGELACDWTPRFSTELSGKAGLHFGYYEQEQVNFAQTDMRDPILGRISAGTVFFATGDDNSGLASTVEVAATAVYVLRHNLKLRIGYEVMVWNGLALAPEQLNDSVLGNETHRDGIMVLNGATVGLDFAY